MLSRHGLSSTIAILLILGMWGCATETEPGAEPAAAAAASGGWLACAQAGTSAKEYSASSNRAGLQAPNRSHNLRTYFYFEASAPAALEGSRGSVSLRARTTRRSAALSHG
jgi:hypothetical protein